MSGQTYSQKDKQPIEEEIENLMHCHNLTAQVSPNPDQDAKCSCDFAMLIARTMDEFNLRATAHGASFTQQHMLKKGPQKFGERGAEASIKNMDQPHQRNCFTPVSVSEMTQAERKKAMEAFVFLTEKQDGSIKGQMVCNGKPTREWLSGEHSANPAAAHKSIMLTAVINAKEGHDVMCANLPNAFIQAKMPEINYGDE
jgi:hypothetical protein